MPKLSKDKVKAMMPIDNIVVFCDTPAEVEASFQTAIAAKKELGEKGNGIAVSKSQVTQTVVIRTGL